MPTSCNKCYSSYIRMGSMNFTIVLQFMMGTMKFEQIAQSKKLSLGDLLSIDNVILFCNLLVHLSLCSCFQFIFPQCLYNSINIQTIDYHLNTKDVRKPGRCLGLGVRTLCPSKNAFFQLGSITITYHSYIPVLQRICFLGHNAACVLCLIRIALPSADWPVADDDR